MWDILYFEFEWIHGGGDEMMMSVNRQLLVADTSIFLKPWTMNE